MKTKLIATTMIIMAFTATVGLFAQRGQGGKEGKKEIHAYVEKNVVPVMKTQRDKLDMVLSNTEKKEVEAIRTDLKALREEMKANRPDYREMKKTGEGPTEEQKTQMRETQKQKRLIMDRAWTIVDNHETTIYKLLDEVGEDQKVWKEDIHAMMEKQHEARKEQMQKEGAPERPSFEGRGKGQGHHKGGKGHMGHGARGGQGGKGMGEMMKPVGFLLWDGTMPAMKERGPRGGQGGQDGKGMGFLNQDSETLVFPNPAQGANSLQYKVETAGQVKIVLLNSEGAVVKQLLSKNQEAGTFTENFDLGDLTPGTYYYKVKTQGNREVKRFVVE